MGKMKRQAPMSALKRVVKEEKAKGRIRIPTRKQILATRFKVVGNDGTVYSTGLDVKDVEQLKTWMFIRGSRKANEALRMMRGYEHLAVDRTDYRTKEETGVN